MGKNCGCGSSENLEHDCSACGEEDELEFLYCPVCNRKVALVELNDKAKEIQCCGKNMINLNDIPSSIGNILECKKCGAKVIIEDDCNCPLEGRECCFTCCGEPMECIGVDEDECGCEGECNCGDDTNFLYCTDCRALLSVVKPCTCKDGCGIQCCGKKMVDPAALTTHAGELFECKKCGAKMVIEEENFCESPGKYIAVTCCGEPMTGKGASEESDAELENEANTALFCTVCERIVITDEANAGKIGCCSKPMTDINSLEDSSGDMFECKKCGAKIIIEEDCVGEDAAKKPEFKCCGASMTVIKD